MITLWFALLIIQNPDLSLTSFSGPMRSSEAACQENIEKDGMSFYRNALMPKGMGFIMAECHKIELTRDQLGWPEGRNE